MSYEQETHGDPGKALEILWGDGRHLQEDNHHDRGPAGDGGNARFNPGLKSPEAA